MIGDPFNYTHIDTFWFEITVQKYSRKVYKIRNHCDCTLIDELWKGQTLELKKALWKNVQCNHHGSTYIYILWRSKPLNCILSLKNSEISKPLKHILTFTYSKGTNLKSHTYFYILWRSKPLNRIPTFTYSEWANL